MEITQVRVSTKFVAERLTLKSLLLLLIERNFCLQRVFYMTYSFILVTKPKLVASRSKQPVPVAKKDRLRRERRFYKHMRKKTLLRHLLNSLHCTLEIRIVNYPKLLFSFIHPKKKILVAGSAGNVSHEYFPAFSILSVRIHREDCVHNFLDYISCLMMNEHIS